MSTTVNQNNPALVALLRDLKNDPRGDRRPILNPRHLRHGAETSTYFLLPDENEDADPTFVLTSVVVVPGKVWSYSATLLDKAAGTDLYGVDLTPESAREYAETIRTRYGLLTRRVHADEVVDG